MSSSPLLTDEAQAREWIMSLDECEPGKLAKLDRLTDLLITENGRQNLVAAASLPAIWLRHYADSAQLLRFVPRETSDWLDLGSGAGFPGLDVPILRPECRVTLVESRIRRFQWLFGASEALGLGNVAVVGTRLELVPDQTFAAISARAFAPLDKLLRLSARFSTADTRWVLPKGRSAQQELHMLSGWQHRFHVEQSLTDADAGVIVGELIKSKGRHA